MHGPCAHALLHRKINYQNAVQSCRYENMPSTTQAYPIAKWIEVVDAWKGVCTPLTWPMQCLSVAQRQQIGMVMLTSKDEVVARVVDRVQSNQPLGPVPRGGADNVLDDSRGR